MKSLKPTCQIFNPKTISWGAFGPLNNVNGWYFCYQFWYICTASQASWRHFLDSVHDGFAVQTDPSCPPRGLSAHLGAPFFVPSISMIRWVDRFYYEHQIRTFRHLQRRTFLILYMFRNLVIQNSGFHCLKRITVRKRNYFTPYETLLVATSSQQQKAFQTRDNGISLLHNKYIPLANRWESHITKLSWSMKHLAWSNFASSLWNVEESELYLTVHEKSASRFVKGASATWS